jgi:hypothetical protein
MKNNIIHTKLLYYTILLVLFFLYKKLIIKNYSLWKYVHGQDIV